MALMQIKRFKYWMELKNAIEVFEKQKQCKLCFSKLDRYSTLLKQEMLDILQQRAVFELETLPSLNDAVCRRCRDALEMLITLKETSQSKEKLIHLYQVLSKTGRVDLDQILIDHGTTPTDKNTICRLCVAISDREVLHLNTKSIYRRTVEVFFPHVNLKVTKNPVICSNCACAINHFHNFQRAVVVAQQGTPVGEAVSQKRTKQEEDAGQKVDEAKDKEYNVFKRSTKKNKRTKKTLNPNQSVDKELLICWKCMYNAKDAATLNIHIQNYHSLTD